MTPNVFSHARSEFSQDAMLAWILAWAEDDLREANPALHELGKEFATSLVRLGEIDVPERFESVRIETQANHVDVLCTINESIALLIEVKIGTLPHSGQLQRYKEQILARRPEPMTVVPVYVQTGEQADYAQVRGEGYDVVRRRDLLHLLAGPIGERAVESSDLVAQFTNHLRHIEADVQSYESKPLHDWSWGAWQGFFGRLQDELGEGAWVVVNNPRGAFLAFHWHWLAISGAEEYLQVEQDRLCHKIYVQSEEKRKELRNAASERLIAAAAQLGMAASRPRFRAGTWMTASVFDGDYRVATDDGRLDLPATIHVLESAQKAFDAACESVAAKGAG